MRYGDRSCEKSKRCFYLSSLERKNHKKRLLGIIGENLVGTLGTLHHVVTRRTL